MGYTKLMGQLEWRVQSGLASIAVNCARRPWLTISVALVITLACGSGLATLEQESKGDILWTPAESRPKDAEKYVEANYAPTPRVEGLLATAPNEADSVLTLARVRAFMQFHTEVIGLKTPKGTTFEDLCLRGGTGKCIVGGVPRLWSGGDVAAFDAAVTTEAQLLATVSAATFPDGAPIVRGQLFGLVKTSDGSANGPIASAHSLAATYVLEAFYQGKRDEVMAWEERLVDLVKAHAGKDIKIYTQTHRSLDDELQRTVGGDVPLFAGTITVMCLFVCYALSTKYASRVAVASAGTLLVFLSMVGAYGLAAAFGNTFTTLVQVLPFILLGIGIDDMLIISNAFELTDRSLPIPDRMGITMFRVGSSITMTSATNFAAFILGTSSSLPAVSWFCAYAGLGVLFDFALQVTAFVAMLALDEKRVQEGRRDVLCCMRRAGRSNQRQAKPAVGDVELGAVGGSGGRDPEVAAAAAVATATEEEGERARRRSVQEHGAAPDKDKLKGDAAKVGALRAFLRDVYGPTLMKPWVKVLVLVAFAGVFAAGVVGIEQVGTDFDVITLTPDDSYLRDYINTQKRMYPGFAGVAGLPVGIYVKGVAYHTAATQRDIKKLREAVEASPYITGPTSSWFDEFSTWAAANATWSASLTADGFFDEPAFQGSKYHSAVCDFLTTPTGSRFNSDIVFYKGGAKMATQYCADADAIGTARFNTIHGALKDSTAQKDSLIELYAICDASALEPKPFPWTFQHLFFEQFRIILGQLGQNFVGALIAIALVCAVFLVHPMAVVVVVLVVAAIDLELVGALHFLDLSVNAVTIIDLVMAIGIVVDYSAHLLHNTGMQPAALSKNDRVVGALTEIGPGVALGAFSTLLALGPLAFSNSEIFRSFFKVFMAIVLLGAGHGMVLMPVLMSWLAPEPHTPEALGLDRAKSERFNFKMSETDSGHLGAKLGAAGEGGSASASKASVASASQISAPVATGDDSSDASGGAAASGRTDKIKVTDV